MMEKIKTGALAFLVVLSLLQSFFLAYSIPDLGTTVSSEQDYVQTEKMGTEDRVENLIFPEDMVLHLGGDRHTVLYPGIEFYDLILGKLKNREFKGFQRSPLDVHDWSEVRSRDIGVELRFGNGVPVELLQEIFRLEGDLLFLADKIDRIWIFKMDEREEVRAYFFSSDGRTVYESIRADLTISDVHEYVGFGTYLTPYQTADGSLYLPERPLEEVETVVDFDTYSPDQMLRNLFFDPGITRAIEDRSGTQIYTDSKRGLQVEQDGQWVRYTNPVASTGSGNQLGENVYTSIQFINQHGGWDGSHRYVNTVEPEEGRTIVFQQYYPSSRYALPILSEPAFRYGMMKLVMQQGIVAEYERSLMTLGSNTEKTIRYLPGGEALATRLSDYGRRSEVVAVYPALKAALTEGQHIRLTPVWAVRLADGTQEPLTGALPAGTVVDSELLPQGSGTDVEALSESGNEEAGSGKPEEILQESSGIAGRAAP
ncbi:YycH family regulatory protein [Paenibacillus abyssi]|uniref:Regulatory protein YycH domain-containing protein n=1 Tax=Paenibacillus abyssi TaxID=1340531 RepID=A0A917FPX9_9BACL|nr:two-component system activity regulator YycH [Paenibacillus abyssi]GGF94025.1 hypothetical protein GCM10010916_09200 [Paenibacillus abyssi]